jgi:spore coat protein U-like protein
MMTSSFAQPTSNKPAYGRIPAGQDVPVATYYDTIQATVNY